MITVAGIDAAPAATGWATIADAWTETAAPTHRVPRQTAAVITPTTVGLPGDRGGWLRVVSTRAKLEGLVVNARPWLVLIEHGAMPAVQHRTGADWRPRLYGAIGSMLTAQVVRFVEVHPTSLKAYACHGRAAKSEMRLAASDAGAPEICEADDNAADAWWLARLGADALQLDHGLPPVNGYRAATRARPRRVRELIEKIWGLP